MKHAIRAVLYAGGFAAGVVSSAAVLAQGTENTAQSVEARQLRAQIRTDPLAPSAGPRTADVAIVVFSDYQCPYCRRFNDTLDALATADPGVRIVYRDWPLQGAGSMLAARAAIAAQYQNKHAAFHAALMHGPVRLDETAIKLAARKSGVDWQRLQADMRTHKADIDALLARNFRYAHIMGLEGTPSLLIGSQRIPGAVDLATLRHTVALARADGRD